MVNCGDIISTLLLLVASLICSCNADYSEILSLSPLKNGNVDVRFSFAFNNTIKKYCRLTEAGKSSCMNHFGDLPPRLIELFSHKIDEVDVTMTNGKWRTKEWGNSMHFTSADGLLVVMNFHEKDIVAVDKIWPLVASLLSVSSHSHRASTKIFPLLRPPLSTYTHNHTCVSALPSASPWIFHASSFAPQQQHTGSGGDSGGRRREQLVAVQSARKTLCVDNIHSAVGLLPCTDKQGLGAILDPYWMVRSPWYAVSMRLVRGRERCSRGAERGGAMLEVCVVETSASIEFGFVLPSISLSAPSRTVGNIDQQREGDVDGDGDGNFDEERKGVVDALTRIGTREDSDRPLCTPLHADKSQHLSLVQTVLPRDYGEGSTGDSWLDRVGRSISGSEKEEDEALGVSLVGDCGSNGEARCVSVPLASSRSAELLRELLESDPEHVLSANHHESDVSVRRDVVDSRSMQVFIDTEIVNSHSYLSAEVQIAEPEVELLLPWWSRYVYSISPLAGPGASGDCGWGRTEVELEGKVLDRLDSSQLPTPCASRPSDKQLFCSSHSAFSVTSTMVSRFVIPPRSRLRLHLPLTKRFVVRELQQTDASRGLDLPPSVVHFRHVIHNNHSCNSSGSNVDEAREMQGEWRVVMTDLWIVTLPFPDASMPFNVVTMACTVAALLFGSIANSLVRKSSLRIPLKALGADK